MDCNAIQMKGSHSRFLRLCKELNIRANVHLTYGHEGWGYLRASAIHPTPAELRATDIRPKGVLGCASCYIKTINDVVMRLKRRRLKSLGRMSWSLGLPWYVGLLCIRPSRRK